MSSSDENECPLCMEPLDVDDLHFYPCTCHYQICRFCWHRIRTDENGLCPACRKPYSENPVTFKPLSAEEFQKIKAHKKKRENQRKRCTSDNRKHLASLRVVQKNLVFAVGLSPRLADPEVLKKQDYFGKFGKIIKVVMNHSSTYAGGSQGPSASAYITFARAEDAIRAIHSVNNVNVDGRTIKTSLGTTKYCSMFLKHLPCNKADCMYLHEVGDEAASFTKEDMNAGKHTEYERRLYEDMMNQINNPLQELLVKSKSSSNIPRGAAAEPCPIPEHPVASSGTSLPTRPAPGTSPIEIPVLPSKKTKKRGKDKRQSDSAASALVAKSPKNKVIVVPSGSSSSTSTASGSTTTTTGAKAKARGTSAEESSGSDRGCSSSPPLLARIVAGATASASSGVKSAEGRSQTMAEVLMKREPSPAGSPGRMSDILLDDGTGASSGYASGSSASSSLQNSRYCAVAASSSSSSASSSSVIPSISTNVQETQQQQQQEQQPQHEEQRVEDVQKVFEQEQQQKEETAAPVEREAEKTGGFAHRVSDYEVSLMRGDFDDLGFDPFAETQKAFAEILDKEVPEASSYGTTVPTSMTPERTNGESGRLSIPPGFSPEHLLPEANTGRIEQPVPSYASGLSEGGSKFLPFLLRNQASQPAPATSVHNDMEERSRLERLMAGLGGNGHYMDRQQTSNNHLQSHMHFNHQQHHHHHQQQQRQEEFARLQQHRQYQPVEERQPVLAFLRSRGLSQEMNTPTSMPTSSSASHTRDSSLYSWNEWEDSLKTLFPTSSGSSTNTVTSMSSQQHVRPPPPGLGMPAPEASGGIARSRFLEDLFGMKTQPIPGSSMGGSASTTTASGDWLEMDPAIVSTTRHAPGLAAGTSSLPIPSRDSGRNSPPAWLLQSLEQLTNDSPPEASPPPVHQFLQFRRQMQPRPTMSSIPPGFWPSSASSQPPPGLAPPPGFGGGGGAGGGGNNIPHSFESPFAPPVGGRPLPHDIFSNDSRLHQQRSALES